MNVWGWILIAALLGSAYFAGSETAVLSSGRLRQRAHSERQRKRLAGLAERLYHRPEQTLVVLLLGNNLVNILASIAGLMLTEAAFKRAGLSLPVYWSDLISSLWVAFLVLLLGEVLPKTVARHYAVRLTRFTAPFLLILRLLLKPVFWLLDALAWLGSSLVGRGRRRAPAVSWETVQLHLETGRAEGVLDEQDEVLIQRIAQLNRLTAESLMIPLDQLSLHPVTGKAGALSAQLAASRKSRAFLHEAGDPRRLTGQLPARRLLCLDPDEPLESHAGRLRRVPWHRPLLELIDELQLANSKFAVVSDHHGHSLGAVFLRDLLRRLVQLQAEWKIVENGTEGSDSELPSG